MMNPNVNAAYSNKSKEKTEKLQHFSDSNTTDNELLYACQLTLEISDYMPILSDYKSTQLTQELPLFHDQTKKKANPIALIRLHELSWKIIKASHWNDINIGHVNGYQGLILVNENKKQVLLAHRGMQFTKLNLMAALSIGMQKIPYIVFDAIKMCKEALKIVKSSYKDYLLYHTGFSMGGFLAQITSAYCNHWEQGKHNKAIVYDAPGATHVIKELRYGDNRQNIIVYVTSPNVVNTATPPYGCLRQITRYKNSNIYAEEGQLYKLASEKPLEIKLQKLISEETPQYITALFSTLETHDQEILRKNLGIQHFFSFEHVSLWPLAKNEFLKDDKNEFTPPHSQEGLWDIIVTMGNPVLYQISREILDSMGMSHVNTVKHQIINPKIIYSIGSAPTEIMPQISEEPYRSLATITVLAILIAGAALKKASETASCSQQQPSRHTNRDSPLINREQSTSAPFNIEIEEKFQP